MNPPAQRGRRRLKQGFIVALLLAAVACGRVEEAPRNQGGSLVPAAKGLLLSEQSDVSGAPIRTTYFGGPNDPGMGSGHFACMDHQWVRDWFVAPSDTFGDPRVWPSEPCPVNHVGGVPDCTRIMNRDHICGRKVKLTCGTNCRSGARDVVVMITDACPKNHPQNRSSGNCQGGPAFDIGYQVWQEMHGRNDNIGVYYEPVASNTPLGPQDSPVGSVGSPDPRGR